MGNPKIPQSDPPAEHPPAANGILAQVGGEFAAAGANSLPKPDSKQEAERTVVIDIPDLGWVRITYKLDWYSHGRGKFWHWRAVRAERVE